MGAPRCMVSLTLSQQFLSEVAEKSARGTRYIKLMLALNDLLHNCFCQKLAINTHFGEVSFE